MNYKCAECQQYTVTEDSYHFSEAYPDKYSVCDNCFQKWITIEDINNDC